MLAQRIMAVASELFHESDRPAIIAEAARLYQCLIGSGRARGSSAVCTALACVYAAARYGGVPLEPAEFLILAGRRLRRSIGGWSGPDGELARRIFGAGGRLRGYLLRRFFSLWSAIALEVYRRSPPPVMPQHLAGYYASWLAAARGAPEGLVELAERAAERLSHRAGGRAARRVALAGLIAASRLLGSPVTASDLAAVFGRDLVGRSRQTLDSLEEMAGEALALLREDLEPRVVPEKAGEG